MLMSSNRSSWNSWIFYVCERARAPKTTENPISNAIQNIHTHTREIFFCNLIVSINLLDDYSSTSPAPPVSCIHIVRLELILRLLPGFYFYFFLPAYPIIRFRCDKTKSSNLTSPANKQSNKWRREKKLNIESHSEAISNSNFNLSFALYLSVSHGENWYLDMNFFFLFFFSLFSLSVIMIFFHFHTTQHTTQHTMQSHKHNHTDMEFLEVLTEGLERVLMVRGGGREVITIYS